MSFKPGDRFVTIGEMFDLDLEALPLGSVGTVEARCTDADGAQFGYEWLVALDDGHVWGLVERIMAPLNTDDDNEAIE